MSSINEEIRKCVICENPLKKTQKSCCSKICRGALSSRLKKGISLSKDHKKLLSEKMKGRVFSDEHKKNISDALKKACEESDVIERRKQTCLEKYGGNSPASSLKVQEKTKQTCQKKYGGIAPACSIEVQEKTKQTNLGKYGFESPTQSQAVQEKMKATMIDRHGVEFALQSKEFQDKKTQTNLIRHGVEHASQSQAVQEKMKTTMIDRHGVENIQQKHLAEIWDNLQSQAWWNNFKSFIEAKEHLSEYLSLSNIYLYARRFRPDWKFQNTISSHHQRVIDLLTDINIPHIVNTKQVIKPLELDTYIPKYNLAIETNGAYRHSELQGRGRDYHLNKTLQCQKLGIRLLHFWDSEIERKWSIVSSMILNLCLSNTHKIYGRKCIVREVDSETARIFFDNNHLQGFCPQSFAYGLYHNEDLVSCMSFAKPRFNKKFFGYELLRFSSKINTTIHGGFSKLFEHYKNKINLPCITYSDNRYSEGTVYEMNGFSCISINKPSYYYFKNINILENRVKFQKHKLHNILPTFDSEKTEWENMKLNGYNRVWDCGTKTWIYNNQ